jgi:hypothetical protein
MEWLGSGGGWSMRSSAAARREKREREYREERKKRKKKGVDDQTVIQRRAAASLMLYCVTRALTTLAPLYPHGTASESRWISKATPSLVYFYVTRVPARLTLCDRVQILKTFLQGLFMKVILRKGQN